MTAFARSAVPFLLWALWAEFNAVAAQALLRNGSFEEGQGSPAGWTIREGMNQILLQSKIVVEYRFVTAKKDVLVFVVQAARLYMQAHRLHHG